MRFFRKDAQQCNTVLSDDMGRFACDYEIVKEHAGGRSLRSNPERLHCTPRVAGSTGWGLEVVESMAVIFLRVCDSLAALRGKGT